jgi:hypothetical protein
MSSKNLLDLHDYVLFEIIKKLDHKSKLQMMATCKKFEGLIGQTHQFYKNFKFRCDQEKSQESEEDFVNIRRKFEIVEIFRIFLVRDAFLRPILEILKKIGPDILKIKLIDLAFHKREFLESMKALPNVREFKIYKIFIEEIDPDENFGHFELKHLTKLEISESTDLGLFATFVPASLETLTINYVWKSKILDPDLLEKQKHLEELNLYHCKIEDFKFDPENCHIEKLTIEKVKFLNDRAFKKYSEFVKIQESVVELKLTIGYKKLTGRNHNYDGILTHLLSLKSLKKFTIDCNERRKIFAIFSRLKIYNPAVETLIVLNPPCEGTDLTSLSKFFPNVIDLKITRLDDEDIDIDFERAFVDLRPINSMKMVRKLKIVFTNEDMLAQLELEELRELYMTESLYDFYDDAIVVWEGLSEDPLANWRTFINNNNRLEVLHILHFRSSLAQLVITLENLPLLKSLEFTFGGRDIALTDKQKKEHTEKAEKVAKLIAENYERFEHLIVDIRSDFDRLFIWNYLEKNYPGAKLNKKRGSRVEIISSNYN